MEYITFDSEKELDVIIIGRVAIDFNPLDYYKPLAESTEFRRYLGGSPANIAVGMARLGRRVGFIGKVSRDQFGDFVIEYFKKEGIDTSYITKCEGNEKLGLTFTEILSETQSSILMYRNECADLKLEAEDVVEEYIEKAKALLISGTALAASPSREAVLKALALAKKNNIKIIFDIDYRPYNWVSTDEITTYYSIVAKESDIILGSREEFDLTEQWIQKESDDVKTANYFHNQGAEIIVIKHGKEGSYAFIKDGTRIKVKPFTVKLLKSFGGGDGYASSFLNGLFQGESVKDSLRMGSASAAMLVASHGCSKDMPTKKELTEFMNGVHNLEEVIEVGSFK